MSIINTLDGLRFHEYGPILSHLNSEVEIKNLYRILRVVQPLIASLDARGGLSLLSLDSVGAGTSLIFNNELPDFFLRSLVPGTNVTLTTSADGKEITIAVSGAGVGNHQLSDNVVHADLGPGIDTNEDDGGEGGAFLAWDGKTNDRWELSDIGNAGTDLDTGPNRKLGCFKRFEAGIRNFGSNNTIGGRHTMRMIETVSGSFLKLTLETDTEDIQIAIDTAAFGVTNLSDVTTTSPIKGALLVWDSDLSLWIDQTSVMRWTRISSDTAPPVHLFRKGRGTIGNETGAHLGDVLGEINFEGHDNTGAGLEDSRFDVGARIKATATAEFSSTNRGTKLQFFTVDNGTTGLDLRLTIDQDGKVTIAKTMKVDAIEVTQTGQVANLNSDKLDAGGTARDWDNVEYSRQVSMDCVGLTGAALVWLNGTTGPSLTAVGTGTPPADSAHYSARIPAKWKAASTVTLKWRFYNVGLQSGTNNVAWRIQYNTPGSSGVVSAVDAGSVIVALANNQAVNTIIETSITISNIAAGDLLNATISVNSTGTDATGDMVILDCPWIEITVQGVPDTGPAS